MVADSHHFDEEHDPDPHERENSDPDLQTPGSRYQWIGKAV